ncbi:MAG: alcohol dehydrogenase catalytic domain-containing protein [Elusimicrobiota bacterium]
MKAAVLTANATLELCDVPEPALAPDECRVRVRAAGVCSSDIARAFEGGAYGYPLIMGHELAGEIVEVGAGLSARFRLGARAAVFPLIPCGKCEACRRKAYARCATYDYYGSRRHGGFAEHLNVRGWNLLPIPKTISFEAGACLEPLAVVVHALRRAGLLSARPPAGEIAILGAGFLGQLASRIIALKHPQAHVAIVDRNAFKISLARPYAAEAAELVDEDKWRDYMKANAGRFAVVVEACGAPETYLRSLELAREGATVLWMGNIAGDLLLDKKMTSSILRKELKLLGTWNSDYRERGASDWTEGLALLEKGLSMRSRHEAHRAGGTSPSPGRSARAQDSPRAP